MSFVPIYPSIYPDRKLYKNKLGKTENDSQTLHDKLSPEKLYYLPSSFSGYLI